MSRYKVYVTPQAWKAIKNSPGHVRQRIRRAIDGFAANPRPAASKELDVSRLPEVDAEVRRLRVDKWRIVYAVTERDMTVDVLAIRKRPPYDYGDLGDLLEGLLP